MSAPDSRTRLNWIEIGPAAERASGRRLRNGELVWRAGSIDWSRGKGSPKGALSRKRSMCEVLTQYGADFKHPGVEEGLGR